MVQRDRYSLGDPIEIRVQLTDLQHQPLNAPSVTVEALLPDGRIQAVTLAVDVSQPGLFVGSFSCLKEGMVQLTLPVPDSNEKLIKRVEVTVPDLERENPQRNMEVLTRLASGTNGKMFQDAGTAITELPDLIKDRTRTMTLSSAISEDVQRRLSSVLMLGMIGLICVEWTLRRLLKLA